MPRKVFISYRRTDARYQARAIYEALVQVIPRDCVFMDVDSIPLGADFRRTLKAWVDKSDILLALIGPEWMNPRLKEPNDLVRIEIAEALARDISVVPVLLDGAQLPRADLLPEDLQDLVYRHAEVVDFTRFNHDVQRLINKLQLQDEEPIKTRGSPIDWTQLGAAPLFKIEDLELSVRTSRCLRDDNVVYIGDLIVKTEAELLRLPNMGRKSVNEIIEVLAAFGLHLEMEIANWPPDNISDLATEVELTLRTRIEDTSLSPRSIDALKAGDIHIVGQLVSHSDVELLRLPNFGRKSLNEVKETLVLVGLRLGMPKSVVPYPVQQPVQPENKGKAKGRLYMAIQKLLRKTI